MLSPDHDGHDAVSAAMQIAQKAREQRYVAMITARAQESAQVIRDAEIAGTDHGLPRSLEETLDALFYLSTVPDMRDGERDSLIRRTLLPLFTRIFHHGYGIALIEGREQEYDAGINRIAEVIGEIFPAGKADE